MIDVNFTIVIQAVNFLVMLWFLNSFVFKPVLRAVEERERKLAELDESARRAAKESGIALLEYEEKTAKMRDEAVEIVSSARREAQEAAAHKLEAARRDFNEKVDEAMAGMNREVEAASKTLRKDVAKFAGALASRILGRSVSA